MDGLYGDQGVWEGHEVCLRALSLTDWSTGGRRARSPEGVFPN